MLDVLGNQETARIAQFLVGAVRTPDFNPIDRVHRLVESIDQTEGHPRHVDFDAVFTALNGLSVSEMKAVEEAYLGEQKRTLRNDLFEGGASGFFTDLTVDQARRLEALLSTIPADVHVGFNPMDRMHRLVEAIDQTKFKFKGYDQDCQPICVRHVDFIPVFNALNGLSAEEVEAVEKAYLGYETRVANRSSELSTLRYDLFRGGDSGVPTDLTVDQVERLEALLGGTRATSAEDAAVAAENVRRVEAAELWSIFWGKHADADIERVMEILRRSAEDNATLVATYERRHTTTFLAVLFQLPLPQVIRAQALLRGSRVDADAIKIRWLRDRIVELDRKIADATSLSLLLVTAAVETMGRAGVPSSVVVLAAQAERKRLVEEIVSRLQLASDEARESAAQPSEAEGDQAQRIATAGDLAVQTRVAAIVGGNVHGFAQLIGGPDEAIVRAIATADPGAKAAAELVKMRQEDTLSGDKITAMFRQLRDQAAMEAGRRHPLGSADEIEAEERILAEEYFDQLKTSWNAAFRDGPNFETLLEKGGGTGAELNKALAKGQGRLDDVTELVFALSGDRKDMETVKRVLHNKSAEEIAALERQYKTVTSRELRFDLFGEAPTKAGETNPLLFVLGEVTYLKAQGKAFGTDRLILEDYMQRVPHQGGPEEVMYLSDRAEREYEYTIDNRGMVGAWRDWWGNEARDLLNATINEVRTSALAYRRLVGWDDSAKKAARPELAGTTAALELLQRIRLARATIRGDRAGYEKATAALREKFRAVASFVVQAVLTAVLTPAAAALFAARGLTLGLQVVQWAAKATVGVASTVGANAIAYGREYSWEQFKADVSGGYMGAMGGAALGKVVGGVTRGMAARLGGSAARDPDGSEARGEHRRDNRGAGAGRGQVPDRGPELPELRRAAPDGQGLRGRDRGNDQVPEARPRPDARAGARGGAPSGGGGTARWGRGRRAGPRDANRAGCWRGARSSASRRRGRGGAESRADGSGAARGERQSQAGRRRREGGPGRRERRTPGAGRRRRQRQAGCGR
jgi:hypothetical protein